MPVKEIAYDLKPVRFQAAALAALQQAVEAYLIKLSIYWEDEALAWSGNALQIMSLQLARTSRPAPFVLIVNDVDRWKVKLEWMAKIETPFLNKFGIHQCWIVNRIPHSSLECCSAHFNGKQKNHQARMLIHRWQSHRKLSRS